MLAQQHMFVSVESRRLLCDLAEDRQSLKAVRVSRNLKKAESCSQTNDDSNGEDELAIMPEMRQVGPRVSSPGVRWNASEETL